MSKTKRKKKTVAMKTVGLNQPPTKPRPEVEPVSQTQRTSCKTENKTNAPAALPILSPRDLAINKLEAEINENLDAEYAVVLQPLVPVLVDLVVSEGFAAAEHILVNVNNPDTHGMWDKILEYASTEQRVELMEQTRQAAIKATLRKIKQEKARWNTFMAALKIAVSLLVMSL